MAEYNKDWQEIPDPTPVAMPIGYEHPESLEAMIARMVRVSSQAQEQGLESLEEADDFDVDDPEDMGILSPHQFTDMQEERIREPLRTPEPEPEPSPAPTPKGKKEKEAKVEAKPGKASKVVEKAEESEEGA